MQVGMKLQVPLLQIGAAVLLGASPLPQTTLSSVACSRIIGAGSDFRNISALEIWGRAQLPIREKMSGIRGWPVGVVCGLACS